MHAKQYAYAEEKPALQFEMALEKHMWIIAMENTANVCGMQTTEALVLYFHAGIRKLHLTRKSESVCYN